MSATMARQGGQVQLEQSDMHLGLNIAKMAEDGFSRAAIEEMKYLIKKPRAEIREENKQGVEFPGHKKVKAAIQRHPAMLHQNQTPAAFLAKMAPQRICRHAGDAQEQLHLHPADPDSRLQSQLHHCPAWHPPPAGNTSGAQSFQIVNLPVGYMYSHKAHASAECFNDDEDTQHNIDFDPDMLTDEG